MAHHHSTSVRTSHAGNAVEVNKISKWDREECLRQTRCLNQASTCSRCRNAGYGEAEVTWCEQLDKKSWLVAEELR